MTNNDQEINVNVRLLLKETGLCSGCINQGLTVLRKASFQNKPNYYQGFFLLSIGIERLLKIIVLSISRVNKGVLPNNSDLKKYGHNIYELFIKISNEIKPDSTFLDDDNMYGELLDFLTEFARVSRYYNLDTLTGSKSGNDPLQKWGEIQKVIETRHCKFEKRENQNKNDNLLFYLFEENDDLINSEEQYFNKFKNLDIIQGYSIYYLYNLISYIVTMLMDITNKKHQLPHCNEFFVLFLTPMKENEIIRKKDWNRL
jgi:hypothetical protein